MSLSDHQIIQHQMFRIRFTELNEIFAVMSLRSFTTGMIGLFIPIYMYTNGYTLQAIFAYQFFMFLFELPFEYLAAHTISRFGPKHAIAISLPPLVLHFWMLSTLQTYSWPLWTVAALAGISMAFYWQAYHYDFSKCKHKTGVTKDISTLYIILAILGAIAPFIGGSLATYYGYDSLYGLVIVLLSFVFIPLIWFREKHVKRKFSLSNLKEKTTPSLREVVAYGGSGIEASISITVWPLFIFAVVGTAQKVGLVTSIALVLSILVTYIVGKKVNNRNRQEFVKAGGVLSGVIYILVIFVETFGQLLSLSFVRSLISSFHAAPFTSEYYLHADEGSRPEHIYFMESAIDVFRVCLFGTLYLLTFIMSGPAVLIAGLMLGAVGAVLTSLMPPARCELSILHRDKTIRVTSRLRPKNATS